MNRGCTWWWGKGEKRKKKIYRREKKGKRNWEGSAHGLRGEWISVSPLRPSGKKGEGKMSRGMIPEAGAQGNTKRVPNRAGGRNCPRKSLPRGGGLWGEEPIAGERRGEKGTGIA